MSVVRLYSVNASKQNAKWKKIWKRGFKKILPELNFEKIDLFQPMGWGLWKLLSLGWSTLNLVLFLIVDNFRYWTRRSGVKNGQKFVDKFLFQNFEFGFRYMKILDHENMPKYENILVSKNNLALEKTKSNFSLKGHN